MDKRKANGADGRASKRLKIVAATLALVVVTAILRRGGRDAEEVGVMELMEQGGRAVASSKSGHWRSSATVRQCDSTTPVPQHTDATQDSNNETPEATTKTGRELLDLLRKTVDKKLSKHFESLPPRRGNEAYYKKVRMPISLGDVEAKLDQLAFANLTELESYVARMVQNAKDHYPASSPQAEDAERMRKAAAGFMAQHNPAYKNPNYEVVPTPIPGDDGADNAGAEEQEEDEQGEEDNDENENDNDDDDDDEDAPRASHTPGRRKSSAASRVVLVSRDTPTRAGRKGSAAPTQTPVSGSKLPDHEYAGVPYKGLTFQQAQEKIVEEIIRRPDEEDATYAYFEPFFNLPPRTLKDYFQVIKDPLSIKKLQKLVKGIRSRTERSGVSEYKSWAAFEDKASLLWENAYYYNEDGSAIANMAKELETMFRDELREAKAVVPEPPQPKIKIKKGAKDKGKDTPTTTTKKITIHVANTRGYSVDSPKAKAGSVAVSGSDAPAHGTPSGRDKAARGAARHASPSPSVVAAGARAGSASVSATVVAATKRESSSRASPALSLSKSTANSTAASDAALAPGTAPAPAHGTPSVNGSTANGDGLAAAAPPPPPAPVVPRRPAYESKFRPSGCEPLLANISLRTNSALVCPEPRFDAQMPPHPKLAQRSLTLNLPAGQWRQHLVVTLSPGVVSAQRPLKMFVISNGALLVPSQSPPQLPLPPQPPNATAMQIAAAKAAETTANEISDPAGGSKLYDVNLHPGVNVIQVQVIVGLAPGQAKLSNGADAELEKVTIFANLLKA